MHLCYNKIKEALMQLRSVESKQFLIRDQFNVELFLELISFLGKSHSTFSYDWLICFLYLLEMDHYEIDEIPLLGLTFVKSNPLFCCELGEYLLKAIQKGIIKMSTKRLFYQGLAFKVLDQDFISGKLFKTEEDEDGYIEVINRGFCPKKVESLLKEIKKVPLFRLKVYCLNDIPILTEKRGHRIEYQSVLYRTREYSVKENSRPPVKRVTDRLC